MRENIPQSSEDKSADDTVIPGFPASPSEVAKQKLVTELDDITTVHDAVIDSPDNTTGRVFEGIDTKYEIELENLKADAQNNNLGSHQ